MLFVDNSYVFESHNDVLDHGYYWKTIQPFSPAHYEPLSRKLMLFDTFSSFRWKPY